MSKKKTMKNVIRLLQYVFKFAPELVVVKTVSIILEVFINIMVNVSLIGHIIDSIARGEPFSEVVKYVLICAGIILIEVIVSAIYKQYLNPRAKRRIYKEVHTLIFKKIRYVDLEKYDDSDFYNDYIWALERADVEVINSYENVMKLISAIIQSFAMTTVICSISGYVILIVVMITLINIVITSYQNVLDYKYEQEVNPFSRKKSYTKRIFYLKQFAREIKTYKISDLLLKNLRNSIDGENEVLEKYKNKKIGIDCMLSVSGGVIQTVVLVLYLAYMGIVKAAVTAGQCASMLNATNGLTGYVGSIFNIIPKLQRNGLYAEKYFNIIDYESEIEMIQSERRVPSFETLEVKNVSFSYAHNEKQVLRNINMKINRGQKVAIVGLNGAGKTTLISLMLHFYNPTGGAIYYNGEDINSFCTEEYREHFGTIFQDFQIYAFSLLENIKMRECMENENLDEVKALFEKVGFLEYSDRLSKNVTKEFDKDGLEFSGGQKQKIAIIRALLQGGELVIMDEASSALDPISEREINQLLFDNFKEKTMIVIAHRLSTIRNVDCIYYLEDGEIVESGTHEELIQMNGKYAVMYNAQAEQYMEKPEDAIAEVFEEKKGA